jgi:predicted ATPase
MSSFLSALKARCEVVTLDGGLDYRRSSELEPQAKWFEGDDVGFDTTWEGYPGQQGTSFMRPASCTDLTETRELGVYGRRVTIPKAKGRACQFTFSDLCEQVHVFPSSFGEKRADTLSRWVPPIISRLLRHTRPSSLIKSQSSC